MAVAIQPCADKKAKSNFIQTVETPVSLNLISKYVDPDIVQQIQKYNKEGAIPVWGVLSRNQKRWQHLITGDIILFYRSNHVFAYARVIGKCDNAALAEKLWGYDLTTGETWQYIYFIDKLNSISIHKSSLNHIAGYKDNYSLRGFQIFWSLGTIYRWLRKWEWPKYRLLCHWSESSAGASDINNYNRKVLLMRRWGLCMCLILAVCLSLAGCTSGKPAVTGKWILSSVSNAGEGLLGVGPANSSYGSYEGATYALTAEFNSDLSFTVSDGDNRYTGTYRQDRERSLQESYTYILNFEDGTNIDALYGVTQYYDKTSEATLQLISGDTILLFLSDKS